MYSPDARRFIFLLIFAMLASEAAGAQKLLHRPPPHAPAAKAPAPKPEPPQKPVLPVGTSLQVEVLRHYPMKAGETLDARLMHPIYAGGKLVVPQGTEVRGQVIALKADNKARWHARVWGDFTPFHTAEVRFDELMLPSGPIPFTTKGVATGAPVLRLAAGPAKKKRSRISRAWSQAKAKIHDQITFFTAPGRGDRLKQMLYSQLPYHPERIPEHTAWSFELAQPLTLPIPPPSLAKLQNQSAPKPGKPEMWSVHALLMNGVNSATAKPGDPIRAVVVEPVYDKNKQLVVPQNSILEGKVTLAKAARSLDRNGKLRFSFQQIRFPPGTRAATPNRAVQGNLAGATGNSANNLSLDAEGTVTPRNKGNPLDPIMLGLMAGRALDQDNMIVHTGVASNGFGFIGRFVGMATGSYNIAAGIGFYAAGVSVCQNFLHRGADVIFPKDTRVDIETTPLRAPVLKAESQPVGQ